MNSLIHTRLELTPVDGKENTFRIGLFLPELELFLEDRYFHPSLPFDRDGYCRIFGKGLNEMYVPIVELTTIDLVQFVKIVCNEWKSGLKNGKYVN